MDAKVVASSAVGFAAGTVVTLLVGMLLMGGMMGRGGMMRGCIFSSSSSSVEPVGIEAVPKFQVAHRLTF